MRARAVACMAACVVAASALLVGCGPKDAPASGQPATGAAAAASPTPSPSPVQAVKDLTPGNCTLYTKDKAVGLLGGVNMNNKALDINTGAGTKIDVCSYLYLKGVSDLQGTTYGVAKFDSAASAFAAAQQLQTEMLGDAAEHNWPVQTLTTPAPGSGQVLGGYGTKTEQGVTFTIAVVGTNVGPYLVAALGASSESPDNAKKFALSVFSALSAAVG
jgi:hypothetical protein